MDRIGQQGVGPFSIVKWVRFQLSKIEPIPQSGSVFNRQVGPFSIDKNNREFVLSQDHQITHVLLWSALESRINMFLTDSMDRDCISYNNTPEEASYPEVITIILYLLNYTMVQ